MTIAIRFRPPMRRWQQRLANELRAAGHAVACVADAGPPKLPFAVERALWLERRLFGPSNSLFDPGPAPSPAAGGSADLVIVLDGLAAPSDTCLEPLFDGVAGEAALLAMLSRGGAPTIVVRCHRRGTKTDLVSGLLAVEDRSVLSRALDQVLARLVTLVLQAVRRHRLHLPEGEVRSLDADREGRQEAAPRDRLVVRDAAPPIRSHPLAVLARGLAGKIAGRLSGAPRGPNHWRIGYRQVAGAGVRDERAWPAQPFTILPDDGARFYADPVPFAHDGRSHIFFEDFPYATAKGVIGCVEIAADGSASAPRTVLEQPCHLSYPLIVPHDGEIYMLPEMGAARRLQLFRADPFPDRWVPDRVLLDDIVVADATPIRHEGEWWMFATLSDDGGSTWDQLGLFHAPDLLGPWTPHPDNPVLVDAGAARPAGALWHENGTLMRVAQDCREGYGMGLAICRVDRLDRLGYAQTVVARLGTPDGYQSDGAHTLDRAGALEVIDLRHSRRPAARRAPGHG